MVDFQFNSSDFIDEVIPVTPFEEMLAHAIQGKISESFFKNVFIQTQFFLGITKRSNESSIDKPEEKKQVPLSLNTDFGLAVAVFSTRYRLMRFSYAIDGSMVCWGREIVLNTTSSAGLVLNPGSFLMFQLPPDKLHAIRRDII